MSTPTEHSTIPLSEVERLAREPRSAYDSVLRKGGHAMPMSNELRDAFNDAICKVEDLEALGPEEPIGYTREGITRGYSISEIYSLVKLYEDRMPDETYEALKMVAGDIRGETWSPGGIEKVPLKPKDHSYKSGADFLEALYTARQVINDGRQRNRPK